MSKAQKQALFSDAASRPLRILVVDDVAVQRRTLAQRLSNAGYAVDMASNGEEALTKVLDGKVDCLITDRDMPGMDGTTLCHHVREADLTGYIFIIMLTGHDSVNDCVAGLAAGADEYISKSANPAELLARLNAGCRILRLERELRAAKATDGLLGVFRRDYLEDQLPREIERAWRYDTPLAVVMTDLDRFKSVNDDHGHAVGDETLRGFCSLARTLLRQADWLARYGGEEFALILPHTDSIGAQVVAERLRHECSTRPLSTSVGPLTVTVSLGVAALLSGANAKSAAADVLRRADTALCRSKREGRNRVTVSMESVGR